MAKRAGTKARPRKVPIADKLPEWSAPLEVIKYPDPRLRAVNARIADFGDGLQRLAAAMMEVMYQDDGVGLAAPQVGINLRLMVFNETAKPGDKAETVLVNPEIVSRSSSTWRDQEGCLSFPGLYADIDRYDKVEVRYQDAQGETRMLTLSNWEAKIFQHEYDHLEGVLFHDRMKAADLERLRPELVAMEEAFLAANPGVEVQRLPPPKPPSKGFGR